MAFTQWFAFYILTYAFSIRQLYRFITTNGLAATVTITIKVTIRMTITIIAISITKIISIVT